MNRLVLCALLCWSVLAAADPPALATYDAKTFTLSVPKGWAVAADATKGVVVAQQDPKRKDAAQMLVMVEPTSQLTDDQVLDYITKQAITGVTIVKREPLPGGGGKLLVADGTTGGIKVRLGAIAVGSSGGVIVGMLIAKASDFAALGGTTTVVAVLGSIKLPAAAAAPANDALAAPSGKSEVMTPTYDSYKNLIVPPPRRAITQADMAGDWKVDGNAVRNYVSMATGGYAGYSAVFVSENYSVDAKGNMKFAASGTHASNNGGGTFQASDAGGGTFTLNSDRVITIAEKGGSTRYFVLRGWFVGPELTIMRINGPYWNLKDVDADPRIKADTAGWNLDTYFVRKTR